VEIGQKVICINSSIEPKILFSVLENYQQWVKQDVIYTVREILNNDDIVPGVLLEEVVNKPIYIKLLGREQEPAFSTSRFRELQDDEVLEEELEEELVIVN
jgi:hypothetical protein